MNTDDYVIWFTVGEDLRSPSLSPVRGDYITPTYGEPDDYVICMNRQSPTVIEGVM